LQNLTDDQTQFTDLKFDQKDAITFPLKGDIEATSGSLLLRARRRKRKASEIASSDTQAVQVQVLGRITQTVSFRGGAFAIFMPELAGPGSNEAVVSCCV